ncbi:hypothetical protein H5410_040461, partial [Solanum commersonii]
KLDESNDLSLSITHNPHEVVKLCPQMLILSQYIMKILKFQERIKSAEIGSSQRIAEKFREAVLCRPMTQSTMMLKAGVRRR